MNPHEVFCPNPACPATGRCGEGNVWIHAQTPPRYCCTVCQRTFSPRAGTPFSRRTTDEAIIAQVVTLVAHGCPIAAIVAAYGFQRQTVCGWLDAAGVQGEAVHQQVCSVGYSPPLQERWREHTAPWPMHQTVCDRPLVGQLH